MNHFLDVIAAKALRELLDAPTENRKHVISVDEGLVQVENAR
jgi:hypothetical protein